MDLGLDGKVAWVLGASSGLGRATALSLARDGAHVAVSARREDELKKVTSEIESQTGARSVAVVLDVTDVDSIPEAARRVEAELGPVDVLVSNAGGPPPGGFEATDDETFGAAFRLTTESAWRLAKSVVPGMKERGSGVLIFLTSSSTKEIIPTLMLSNTMRAAVVGLAKTMSKELGPHGIRVLCIAPGRIDTDRLKSLDENTAKTTNRSPDEVRAATQALIPLGRYGRPEELGDVIAFLASERASYMTGTTVLVDGGLLNGILS
ncbi:MAG: SDR family oxidoreductase [Actinomycetota bacterium]